MGREAQTSRLAKSPGEPMTKRRHKPSTPADITARRAEKRAFEDRGLIVNVDSKDEKILSVMRYDCFAVLLRDEPSKNVDRAAERNAILWFEQEIRTANGECGGERRPDYIRGSAEGAPGQTMSQLQIEASWRLEAVEKVTPTPLMRLLYDLLKPDAAIVDPREPEAANWRSIVARHVGETNPAAQGAVVRMACTWLAWVHANIGRLVEEAKAKRRMAA